MKLVLSMCVLAVLAGVAFGEEGVLTPVAIEPSTIPSLGQSRGELIGYQFGKPGGDSGTVSSRAVMTTLQTMFSPIAVAIDSTEPDAVKPEVVRIDFTGEGKFADAVVARLKPSGEGRYEILPTAGEVRREELTVPVMVSGVYYNMSQGPFRQMTLRVSTGLQGQCRFGDTVRTVRAIDLTGNLYIGGMTSVPFRRGALAGQPSGDMVVVADANGSFERPSAVGLVGRNVFLDGKAYKLEISEDGKRIKAQELEVQTGRINLGDKPCQATLVSKDYIIQIQRDKLGDAKGGPITLPVDRYAFLSYTQTDLKQREQTADDGLKAIATGSPTVLQLTGVGTSAAFDVEAGKTLEPAVGCPLEATAEVRQTGRETTFTLKVADRMGNRVENLTAGRAEPIVEVFDEKGEKIHSGKMAYG